MYFFTTAKKALDLASTREVEPYIAVYSWGEDGRVRLVDVEKSCVGMQRALYLSNLNVMLTQEEFVTVIDAGTVLLVEPRLYVRIYTDAPTSYDWAMYTIELHPHIAEMRKSHAPVRLVLITKTGNGEPMQCGRYGSGLHMALTQQHFEEQLYDNLEYGLVVPVPATSIENNKGDAQ